MRERIGLVECYNTVFQTYSSPWKAQSLRRACRSPRKEVGSTFPNRDAGRPLPGHGGNASKLGDVGGSPVKSSLFLFLFVFEFSLKFFIVESFFQRCSYTETKKVIFILFPRSISSTEQEFPSPGHWGNVAVIVSSVSSVD